MSGIFRNAWPYQQDALNLPVKDVEAAVSFYQRVMGFQIVSRHNSPHKSIVLGRDNIKIGLAENGGDPTQDGCFIEVENAETAFAELKANGLEKNEAGFRLDQQGDTTWKVFFVVAPDGLCYCLGEKLSSSQPSSSQMES
jgi:catechol 2,3-dioxygenase-like lactoylglutathione lyase family enzyme